MLGERITLHSPDGANIALDAYIPEVTEEIDPNVRRASVVICPGGGYHFKSAREAEPVALRFLAEGFNAFVVWYRVAPSRFPVPQQDLALAVAHVRQHAEEYHCNPHQIAVLGFSAGGHLAGSLGALWHKAELWAPLTPNDVRPNAMVLCYPVITGGEYAHRGSFENLTGDMDASHHAAWSVDGWVTEHCPPTFLWHTFEDASVPVENAYLMAQALARHGVLTELHVFPHGGHGASLCNEQTSGVRNPQLVLKDNAAWPGWAARFLRQAMGANG